MDAFEEGCQWLCRGEFSDSDVEEAKLSAFQSVDAPVSPSAKGLALFKSNITPEMQQQRCGYALAFAFLTYFSGAMI